MTPAVLGHAWRVEGRECILKRRCRSALASMLVAAVFLLEGLASAAEETTNAHSVSKAGAHSEHLEPAPGVSVPGVGAARDSQAAESNAIPVAEPTRFSPAFTQTDQPIVSSNVLGSLHASNAQASAQGFQIRLDLARQQRQQKNYSMAATALLELSDSTASDEIKRTALLELALLAQDQNDLPKAQRAYNQYLIRFPTDANVPEVLLRQGLLYREMGATHMALSKFYAVMTSAMGLQADQLETYRRLVLQSQTEIAETYYLLGKHAEAADFFRRLLKLDSPILSKPTIQFKLINSLVRLGLQSEVVGQAEDFLKHHPGAGQEAEVRFLLANALKQTGRNDEALAQVMQLLKAQQSTASQNPANWSYWQQRTGKEIAAQLFKEEDFLHSLDIYLGLLALNPEPAWQFPLHYQMGLAFERLEQPGKASDAYTAIIARENELTTNATPALKAVVDMAKWRKDFIGWQVKAEKAAQEISALRPKDPPLTANP